MGARFDRPWDNIFADWIDRAKAVGGDPNDIGDLAWSDFLQFLNNETH